MNHLLPPPVRIDATWIRAAREMIRGATERSERVEFTREHGPLLLDEIERLQGLVVSLTDEVSSLRVRFKMRTRDDVDRLHVAITTPPQTETTT